MSQDQRPCGGGTAARTSGRQIRQLLAAASEAVHLNREVSGNDYGDDRHDDMPKYVERNPGSGVDRACRNNKGDERWDDTAPDGTVANWFDARHEQSPPKPKRTATAPIGRRRQLRGQWLGSNRGEPPAGLCWDCLLFCKASWIDGDRMRALRSIPYRRRPWCPVLVIESDWRLRRWGRPLVMAS